MQGKPPGASGAPIINHPDVKRMLLMMKAQTEASRALTLYTAMQFDLAEHGPQVPAAHESARYAAVASS